MSPIQPTSNQRRGKEITPRRRAVIVAFRCLEAPISFRQIQTLTGVSKSTASDIWKHALSNAGRARLQTEAIPVLMVPDLSPSALPIPLLIPPLQPTVLPAPLPSASLLLMPPHSVLPTPAALLSAPLLSMPSPSVLPSPAALPVVPLPLVPLLPTPYPTVLPSPADLPVVPLRLVPLCCPAPLLSEPLRSVLPTLAALPLVPLDSVPVLPAPHLSLPPSSVLPSPAALPVVPPCLVPLLPALRSQALPLRMPLSQAALLLPEVLPPGDLNSALPLPGALSLVDVLPAAELISALPLPAALAPVERFSVPLALAALLPASRTSALGSSLPLLAAPLPLVAHSPSSAPLPLRLFPILEPTLPALHPVEYNQHFSLLELIKASVLDPAPRLGRPRLLNESDKDKLITFVKGGFASRRMRLQDIRRESGLTHVSDSTVFRAMAERGIHAYREVFKFILSTENKLKRVIYCLPRVHWLPENEWANYAFTDEMSIEIGGLLGASTVWREKGEKWHDDCVGVKKKRGISVMCWGMISWNWKGPFWVWESETDAEKAKAAEDIKVYNLNCMEEEKRLNDLWKSSPGWRELKEEELKALREARAEAQRTGIKIKTTQSWRGKKYKVKPLKRGEPRGVDSWRYVTALARPLLWPTCTERLQQNPDFLLMEDNAPAHFSDFTTFERVKAGIPKVDWPPNSPDFNPLEHLWEVMKSRIQTRRGHERVTSIRDMKIILQQEWGRITVEEVNKQISKLPRVMAKYIEQQGGNKFHG